MRLIILRITILIALISIWGTTFTNHPARQSHISLIKPGVGVDDCKIYDTKNKVKEVYGGWDSDEYGFLCYKTKGIEFEIADDVVVSINYYFNSMEYKPFIAKTDRGIDENSLKNDVISAYGEDYKETKRIITNFGNLPNTEENVVYYDKDGILFVFWNGKLAYVKVCKPKV